MRAWLQRLWTTPVFDADDRMRQQQLFAIVVAGLLGGTLPILVASLVGGDAVTVSVLLVNAAVMVVLLLLARRGNVQLASFLAMITLLIAVTLTIAADRGINDVGAMLYPVTLMVASILLNQRGFVVVVVVLMVVVLGVMLAELTGMLATQGRDLARPSDIPIVLTILGFAALVVRLIAHSFTRNLELARSQLAERQCIEQQLVQRESESHQVAARARALADISQVLAEASPEYRRVLDVAVQRCAALIGDGASIFLLHPGSAVFELAAVYNPDPEAVAVFRAHMLADPIRVDEGGYGVVIATGQPLLVPEIDMEQVRAAATPERRAYYEHLPLYSLLLAPLRAHGQILGVLGLGRHRPGHPYTVDDRIFLQDIADRVALAVENARLYTELQGELAERQRIQLEREALIARLESQNAELERFTYTVSHDLKSPLVTIRGFLGFVEQDVRAGDMDRLQRDLGRIKEASTRMQCLLDELLELSRVGRTMHEPVRVPFGEIVHAALELVEGQLRAHAVEVVVAPDLPVVMGDRARLVEVVQNLVDNAVKFMGDQPAPRIEIGVRPAMDGTPGVFFVRDNGIGIDPQFHSRIFGLFDKLDARSEGTGVGLALVKRIVEVHQGTIWVESAGKGAGSMFCFTLGPGTPGSA